MKPPPFEYEAPTTLESAVALLEENQFDAKVLAGGQSLMPLLNMRLARPALLIDLARIPGFDYLEDQRDALRIGAMTRQRAIEFSPVVADKLPLLAKAIKLVGHLPTRSRGTVGGSIANADPAAEIPMVLQALDGTVVARGPKGERVIAASELFRDAMTTALAADEILVEIRLPTAMAKASCAIEEFARRKGDFAIAAIAAVIEHEDGIKARIATAGVSACPQRLRAAEKILEQQGLGDSAIAQAAEAAAKAVEPLSDRNASAAYRRQLTQVLTERAVRGAM